MNREKLLTDACDAFNKWLESPEYLGKTRGPLYQRVKKLERRLKQEADRDYEWAMVCVANGWFSKDDFERPVVERLNWKSDELLKWADARFAEWMDCTGIGDDESVMMAVHDLVILRAEHDPEFKAAALEHGWTMSRPNHPY